MNNPRSILGVAVLFTVSTVNATLQLTIAGPDGTGIENAYRLSGGSVNTSDIVRALNAISPALNVSTITLPEKLYKATPNNPDEGDLAGSYNLIWVPLDAPESATISHVNGTASFDTTQLTWLLAKDGVSSYVWNLTGLWDGFEDIAILNLWPEQGNFSHIAMGGSIAVPEPTTIIAGGFLLLLLGLKSLPPLLR